MWYWRTGKLEWGGQSSDVRWKSYLRRRSKRQGGVPEPTDGVRFERPLEAFGPTVEGALAEVRRGLAAGGALLDGVPLDELRLDELRVSFDDEGAVCHGELAFKAKLRVAPAFPFAFEGPPEVFFSAMIEAVRALSGLEIVADEIKQTPEYWVFPAHQTGCLGAIFDRRKGRAVAMGSAFPTELWLWGYERGLLEEPPGDLVVFEVRDEARAVNALRRLVSGFRASQVADLPLVVRGGATWMAIGHLHEAGDALGWRIERAPEAAG